MIWLLSVGTLAPKQQAGVSWCGNAALSLWDGLASADTGGRNAAFPSVRESCHPHLNLPEEASFSKAVALQIWSPAAIAGGIQCGASRGFPTTADVGLPHQHGGRETPGSFLWLVVLS